MSKSVNNKNIMNRVSILHELKLFLSCLLLFDLLKYFVEVTQNNWSAGACTYIQNKHNFNEFPQHLWYTYITLYDMSVFNKLKLHGQWIQSLPT
jgi:hypothetical protein